MYEIVIERHDAQFRAYCPALPGVEAVGESKEAVIERMYEIIPQRLNEPAVEGKARTLPPRAAPVD